MLELLDFIFILFLFYFLNNEDVHDCSHMTLYYRPRI